MDDFISTIESSMPEAQASALEALLGQADKDGYPIQRSGTANGLKMFALPADATNPTQYNTAITAAIADLHAVYDGIDTVSQTLNGVDTLNKTSLARVQNEVERLEGTLAHVSSLIPASAAYTHVVKEDFITDNGDAAAMPADWARLQVNKDISSLVRPIAMDVSRISSGDKDRLCKVTIEELLGTTSADRHPVSEAVDGSMSTYWQEVIHANAPIMANKALVPWLSNTNYSGGAAVKLRFDFEALTPVSEISLKPLADYPIEVLNVSWSTDTANKEKGAGGTVNIGGDFNSGIDTQKWSLHAIGATATTPAEGQDGTHCLLVDFDGNNTSRYVLNQTAIALKPGAVYCMSFKAKSSSGRGFVSATISSNKGKSVLFRQSPTLTKKWMYYTYLITMPTSISDSPVIEIQCYDKESIWLDDIRIDANSMSMMLDNIQSSKNTMVIPLAQNYGKPVMCRTMWITLSQRNYNLRHYSIPKSQIEAANLWTSVLTDSPNGAWATNSSPWRRTQDLLPPGMSSNSPLADAAKRVGGKLKSMLASLIRMANADTTEMVDVVKYEYTLGAWEIDLRYKDYGPEGYWLSKPLDLRGEIRQLTVLPNLGPIEAEQVKFYLLPQSDSTVDISNAYCLNNDWTVYFRSSTEKGLLATGVDPTAANVMTLPPRDPRRPGNRSTIKNGREVFPGTDRKKKVQLGSFPYFDADKAWAIHTQVTDGQANKLNRYDPNALIQTFADSTAIVTTPGYSPMRVSLKFPNGQVVPPDILGRVPFTKFRIWKDYALTEVLGTSLTDQSSTTSAGSTATQQSTRNIRTFKTSKPICYIAGVGAKLAIYAHKKDAATSTDILIDPSKYKVAWETQLGSLSGPAGNFSDARSLAYSDTIELEVDSIYEPDYVFSAYYRTEMTGGPIINEATDPTLNPGDTDYSYRESSASAREGSITTLGIQSYPVTRNVTDYLTGKTKTLRPAVMDRTLADYYPVYEYYVDESGNVIFANDLFEYGDYPATIELEYKTLDINPRILISYEPPVIGTSTCSTPLLGDYTILLNART